jgi:hypothetical protein
MSGSPDIDDVRWYTTARKFPKVIARSPHGARLWGGPYTYAQGIVGAGILIIGVTTHDWWSTGNIIADITGLFTVVAAVVFALKMLPVNTVNPLPMIAGYWRALAAPKWGTLAGVALRPAGRPRRYRTQVIIYDTLPPHVGDFSVADIPAQRAPLDQVAETAPLVSLSLPTTRVDQLLAKAGGR